MKLPLAKYSVDGAAAEGSWALLSRCTDEHSSEDSESESKDEFEDDKNESGGGGESVIRSRVRGGGGSSLSKIGEVGPIRGGGRKRRPSVRV